MGRNVDIDGKMSHTHHMSTTQTTEALDWNTTLQMVRRAMTDAFIDSNMTMTVDDLVLESFAVVDTVNRAQFIQIKREAVRTVTALL